MNALFRTPLALAPLLAMLLAVAAVALSAAPSHGLLPEEAPRTVQEDYYEDVYGPYGPFQEDGYGPYGPYGPSFEDEYGPYGPSGPSLEDGIGPGDPEEYYEE